MRTYKRNWIQSSLIITLSVLLMASLSQFVLRSIYRDTLDEMILDSVEDIRISLNENFNADLLKSYAKDGYFIQIENEYDGFKVYEDILNDLKVLHHDHEETIKHYFGDVFAIYDGEILFQDKVQDFSIVTYRPVFIHEDEMIGFEKFDDALYWITMLALLIGNLLVLVVSVYNKKKEETLILNLKDLATHQTIDQTNISDDIIRVMNHLVLDMNLQKDISDKVSKHLSHEIRTPLTALTLILENIELGLIEPNSQTLSKIQTEIERIKTLTLDIKSQETETKKMYEEPKSLVNIDVLLDHVLFLFSVDIQKKRLKIQKDIQQSMIYVNESRFLQVLINIFSNAVKFTDKNGMIQISSFLNSDKDTVIQITNTYEHSNIIHKEKVFEAYYSTSGEGLGLNITQEILKAQRATIKIIDDQDLFGLQVILKNN